MNDHEYFELFAINLKKLRKKAEKTQMDIAVDADMSLSYYSGLEQGKQNPSLKQLRKLSEVFSCDIAKLVRLKPRKPKAKPTEKKKKKSVRKTRKK